MVKKLTAAATACILLIVSMTAFADSDPNLLFTELGMYSGVLYFCDSTQNTVVLKSVQPVYQAEGAEWSKTTAAEAEYKELALAPVSLTLQDGTALEPIDLNVYADSYVKVLIGRNGYGLKILSLKFI